jgi:metal-responsive CopG/Arc/MetJ family transcriptional regulator
MCLDNELIEDMDYYAKTYPVQKNRSRAIEEALREVIPRRNLSTSDV